MYRVNRWLVSQGQRPITESRFKNRCKWLARRRPEQHGLRARRASRSSIPTPPALEPADSQEEALSPGSHYSPPASPPHSHCSTDTQQSRNEPPSAPAVSAPASLSLVSPMAQTRVHLGSPQLGNSPASRPLVSPGTQYIILPPGYTPSSQPVPFRITPTGISPSAVPAAANSALPYHQRRVVSDPPPLEKI